MAPHVQQNFYSSQCIYLLSISYLRIGGIRYLLFWKKTSVHFNDSDEFAKASPMAGFSLACLIFLFFSK
jgi:hypothetical protein